MGFLNAIERSIRRAVLASLRLLSERKGSDGVLPEFSGDQGNPALLLIRIDRIGDAIVSTPVLDQLRCRFPDARIDILLGEKNGATARLLPGIDNHYFLRKSIPAAVRTIRQLRKNGYDAVVNLHLNPSGSADLVSRLVGGTALIERREELPEEKTAHVVVRTSRLLAPLGVEAISNGTEREHPLHVIRPASAETLSTGSEGRVPAIIALNVTVAGEGRRWPRDHYVALARLLKRKEMAPVIVGAPSDEEMIRSIARDASAEILPPARSFLTFAERLAGVDLVVTPDTSVVHLAAALRKPVVALYASQKAGTEWRPWGTTYETIINTEGMDKISPEDVLERILRISLRTEFTPQAAGSNPVEGAWQ